MVGPWWHRNHRCAAHIHLAFLLLSMFLCSPNTGSSRRARRHYKRLVKCNHQVKLGFHKDPESSKLLYEDRLGLLSGNLCYPLGKTSLSHNLTRPRSRKIDGSQHRQ